MHHELTSIRFATSERHKVKGSCNWPIRKPLLRGSLDENHNAEVPDVEAQLLAEVTSDITHIKCFRTRNIIKHRTMS